MNKRGFTLIELMIAVIIIGILASIAAPTFRAMKARAICAEAVTAMATIRLALRQYYVEYAQYPVSWGESFLKYHATDLQTMGVNIDDLTGRYFEKDCYGVDFSWINPAYPPTYKIYCLISPMTGSADAKAILDTQGASGTLYMYLESGTIGQVGISQSGYPED